MVATVESVASSLAPKLPTLFTHLEDGTAMTTSVSLSQSPGQRSHRFKHGILIKGVRYGDLGPCTLLFDTTQTFTSPDSGPPLRITLRLHEDVDEGGPSFRDRFLNDLRLMALRDGSFSTTMPLRGTSVVCSCPIGEDETVEFVCPHNFATRRVVETEINMRKEPVIRDGRLCHEVTVWMNSIAVQRPRMSHTPGDGSPVAASEPGLITLDFSVTAIDDGETAGFFTRQTLLAVTEGFFGSIADDIDDDRFSSVRTRLVKRGVVVEIVRPSGTLRLALPGVGIHLTNNAEFRHELRRFLADRIRRLPEAVAAGWTLDTLMHDMHIIEGDDGYRVVVVV